MGRDQLTERRPNATPPAPRPGWVVEFMQGNQPQMAWVLEEQSGRLRLLTINKREIKLAAARILPWTGPVHDPAASRQEIMDLLHERQERRSEIQAGLEVLEIWELAQAEMREATLDWLAGLLWSEPGPDELAALGRALLAAKAHFKFQPPCFEIFPAEKVEARLAAMAEEQERERMIQAGSGLFKALWAAHRAGRVEAPDQAGDLEPKVAQRLKALLLAQVAKSADEKSAKLWALLRKGLPEHPHQALLLAQAWGVLPPHHNQFLDVADFTWGDDWSRRFADQIADQAQRAKALEQEPEPTVYRSIDSATTRDIDDAFLIRPGARGGFSLSVALACPALTWEFQTPLDKAVFHRATSLYLPEGASHMLPEALGTDLFSLRQGQVRPALVLDFELDAEAGVQSLVPRQAWIRVAENITYEQAEAAICSGADPDLALARDLAQRLMNQRISHGASIIRNPDPVVELEGQGRDLRVSVSLKPACPAADLVVSELMILANSAVAGLARDKGLALLHRTQDIGLPAEAAGEFSEPEDIYRLMRYLAPTVLETAPRRHAALGVAAYSPVSSPLRRYTDLLNSAQVLSWIKTGGPRFQAAELEALAPQLNARIQAVSQVQRFRPRYWKLVYLAQNKKRPAPAVLVDCGGPFAVLALPELQINVQAPSALLGDKLRPGQRFELTFGRIDPLTNDIKVASACEA